MVINNGKITNTSASKQLTGEKVPGDLNSWDYFGTDPNEILKYNYNLLCERSTTLFHTHAPVSAAINKRATYAIGKGLHFRSQPDYKTLGITKESAKDWGMRFQSLIHYMFLLLNFYGKQSTLFKTADIMGDSILIFDRTFTENNMPFDLIETGGDSINFQAASEAGESVSLGILHDKFLRKKGIVQNDVEQTRVMFKNENGDQNLLQYYNKQMARQLRGYPLAYKIIASCKNNDRWWDATLGRAVLESIMFATVSNTESDIGSQLNALADAVRDENGNAPKTGVSSVTTTQNLGTGNVVHLQGKGEMKFNPLVTPSNNFDKFQNAFIEIVGMATNVPPECVMSKYSTSFTAHKGALNDFVKSYTMDRYGFQRTICYPVVLELAKYMFMEGLIEMPKSDFFTNPITQMATLAGNWLGPVPGHINPLQEINALIAAKDNALTTPADAAAQYGSGEYEDFIEEWQQQMEQFNKMSPEKKAQAVQAQDEKDENI